MSEEHDLVVEAFGGLSGSGWIRANCPFCLEKSGKADARQSMGLNTETGGYNCFKCGTHGRLPESMLDQVPYLPPAEQKEIKREPVELADGYIELYDGPGAASVLLEPARAYLRGRKLSDAVVADAKVGACIAGRLRGRVVVPIFDYADLTRPWRGWVSRDYTGLAYRPYLYPRNMDREGLLYNEPCLWEETDRPAFVVEGTLDTLALWPDSVAVLGKPLDSQVAKLVAARRPVVVVLDGDAHVEGWSLAMKLRFLGQRAGSVRLPPRVDPDEVPRDWLDEEARRSLP